jgi:hypothetical protein
MPQEQTRDETKRRPGWAVLAGLAAAVVCAVGGLAFILFAPLPGASRDAEAATLGRGIIDYRLEQAVVDPNAVPALVGEMGSKRLRAGWTRVMVRWASLQPFKPGTANEAVDADGDGYADAYLGTLTTIVEQLHAAGIRIILTPVDTPKWASDRDWWSQPPPGDYEKNTYYPFYAPDMGDAQVRGQFGALGTFLARRFAGKAKYFECWNEPNQGFYLYPQTPVSATSGGGAIYLEMLKVWYKGVKKGSRDAVVIGGATAPRGRGDITSTPPQAFARYLKANDGASFMDAYSHHPYTPGGSTRLKPGELPNNPARCVTLGNLGQLTKLFPGKPFYLTEFGYNTKYSQWFGVTVSESEQARYLRQAFAYAKRYPQVKALLWFLVDDWNPTGGVDKAGEGVYMGVRTYKGSRKQSWYAFAGGNSLTLAAPGKAKAGSTLTLTGKLTYRPPSEPRSQVLTLQSRNPSGSAWRSLVSIRTAADGSYARKLRQGRTKVYRVVWGGVCESPARTVKTP